MRAGFQNVWLYCDANASMEAPLAVALEVAQRHGAVLTLLSVVEQSNDRFLRTPVGQELLRLLHEDKAHRLQDLQRQAQRELGEHRVPATMLEGEVAWHRLTAHAVKHRPDLLVVAADGGAPAGPFGTFSHHLFRKCPVPVWSVRSRATRGPMRALVAVECDPDWSDEQRLDHRLLTFAAGLAAVSGIELHIAHAWSLFGENLIASRYGPDGARPYLDLQLQSARECTEELLRASACKDVVTAVHHPKGEPGTAIPALAETIGADVVVLGSAARRGLAGLFIGSVAETILNGLGCSALVVKRPDFVSPVHPR